MKFIKPFKINKILLIRPEMMGDIILLTPIISAIKKYYPQSQIYMLLQSPMEEVIKNNNEISGYILTKKNLSFKEILGLSYKIRKEKFDISIVFEDNPTPQFAYLSLLSRIPIRIGDKSRILYGWIYNYGVWIDSSDKTKHHVELYLGLLEPLGIKDCYMPLKININKDAEKKILKILPHKENNQKFIGIHIGTGGGNRALLPETYAQISDLIQEKLCCKVFLIGGKREIKTLDKIKGLARRSFIDMVDKLSIQELFALIKNLDLFIGVDSGPLHAAAAFKIPIIAIYTANDVNPARWLPWMTKSKVIKSRNDCRLKCSHRECNYDYCLKAINPLEIIAAAINLLNMEELPE